MVEKSQQFEGLVPVSGRQLSAVGASAGNVPTLFLRSDSRAKRFWEFFTANIRNKNTPARTSSPSRNFRIGVRSASSRSKVIAQWSRQSARKCVPLTRHRRQL